MWKTDLLYQAMENHPAYCPSILVVPRCNADDIEANTKKTELHFLTKGYRVRMVMTGKNSHTDDELLDGDIIFFTHPHNDSLERFSIAHLRNKLTCYVPYFEMLDLNYSIHFNGPTENLVWKFFQINELHKHIAEEHAYNRGRNIDVVGYPATEALYNDQSYDNPWKRPELKKIIFAPHHSISNSSFLSNSTFIENADYLRELAIRYSGRVNFAFKPHPLLKDKLYRHPDWGVKKTDEYWAFWSSKPNLQLEEGEYVGLFRESDAMIHDCTSFITEYLYTGKPALYLNPLIRDRLNDYGKLGYDAMLKAEKQSDIEKFIVSIIRGDEITFNEDMQKKLRPPLSPTAQIMTILNEMLVEEDKL
ncbi:CDP-glycerol glycerophosphotransferase family protein (plasmid) [Vibrio alfacsensis]|uniref:CDP-glycerol glycerophosphotransferase family protein n=1 Tax=Vibrio alfacsensis TaxID=1074311 RepID=UPI002ADD8395|nr:CDP-glycerol glycerophosphotransferase family protein [Vibrio alfacsensis]WQE79053.1 CDP-glycerol glycerophosphotransferase family protein [Vibrio alfacsensis]